ncbi:type I restriction-modification system subunit M [Aequorivita marina]|uniref:type I restriction-modification system subunit M n=1 Tax=Aequorivita marina TaxID=3073654 RepID=UPI0028741AB0|nr:class I SAM-dependent DNA methyltransferase [Aequorivita sp. S2608]MDS1297080.1 class I SAM-dependent DNA methyltransferase [Aequorivita sp. S2608]
MTQNSHSKLIAFIWSIADDCLRDVYVRGKYRDVILPMVVLRRLDALLEPSKQEVMDEVQFQTVEAGFTELESEGLKTASGYEFYNTSKWTLQLLKDTASNNQSILLANFEDYILGFSDNVKEIISKFNLGRQVKHMASKDVLLDVLEKFTSPHINLTPFEKKDPDGYKLPALSNLGMGYVFEELIRKFNEENNEEAGEHFTPREVIELMTHLVFKPVKDQLPPVMTIYDPACGSGGMLTESQNFIKDENGAIQAKGDVYLFGKEINDETYAICKSDMMIKGNDPQNIRLGSTLSTDEFSGNNFDFMLSNPPYGKSWASEQKYIKDGKDIIDPRFTIQLSNYWQETDTEKAIPRSSDGQLLFLMEMVSKMKSLKQSPLGSRIASVHNGSSLFTGDAGSGESNIRRYLIENDLLEAIVQLPNNLFYNTGITTYIWLLSNNKTKERQGKVQLIDAQPLYQKLRKNLGQKNCEFSAAHIAEITQTFLNSESKERLEDDQLASKIFDNKDFGYYKVTIERPKRLRSQFTTEAIEGLRYHNQLQEPMEYAYQTYGDKVYTELPSLKKELLNWCEANEISLSSKKKTQLTSKKTWEDAKFLIDTATKLYEVMGDAVSMDFNHFSKQVNKALKKLEIKLSNSQKKAILDAVSVYDPEAEKVIKATKTVKGEKLEKLCAHLDCTPTKLHHFGYFPSGNKDTYTIYESESDLRDYENVPLNETIYDYFLREVLPHVEESWIDLDKTKIGYEISFNKYFYQHKALRPLDEIDKDIRELETKSEGLIMDILNSVNL